MAEIYNNGDYSVVFNIPREYLDYRMKFMCGDQPLKFFPIVWHGCLYDKEQGYSPFAEFDLRSGCGSDATMKPAYASLDEWGTEEVGFDSYLIYLMESLMNDFNNAIDVSTMTYIGHIDDAQFDIQKFYEGYYGVEMSPIYEDKAPQRYDPHFKIAKLTSNPSNIDVEEGLELLLISKYDESNKDFIDDSYENLKADGISIEEAPFVYGSIEEALEDVSQFGVSPYYVLFNNLPSSDKDTATEKLAQLVNADENTSTIPSDIREKFILLSYARFFMNANGLGFDTTPIMSSKDIDKFESMYDEEQKESITCMIYGMCDNVSQHHACYKEEIILNSLMCDGDIETDFKKSINAIGKGNSLENDSCSMNIASKGLDVGSSKGHDDYTL